ncbi:putative leader peptide [Luteococcus peritonei]|uniref:Leader peptide n=1 Tax=Luteococcus peritonei TaxID=88874 RepID=A0ABW4RX18_9ACTN
MQTASNPLLVTRRHVDLLRLNGCMCWMR